jgi:hypothetical protein
VLLVLFGNSCQVGNRSVVDLASEEEPCASASLHVAVNSKARVVGMTKSGSSGLDPSLTQVRRAAGVTDADHACRLQQAVVMESSSIAIVCALRFAAAGWWGSALQLGFASTFFTSGLELHISACCLPLLLSALNIAQCRAGPASLRVVVV